MLHFRSATPLRNDTQVVRIRNDHEDCIIFYIKKKFVIIIYDNEFSFCVLRPLACLGRNLFSILRHSHHLSAMLAGTVSSPCTARLAAQRCVRAPRRSACVLRPSAVPALAPLRRAAPHARRGALGTQSLNVHIFLGVSYHAKSPPPCSAGSRQAAEQEEWRRRRKAAAGGARGGRHGQQVGHSSAGAHRRPLRAALQLRQHT